LLGNFLAAVFDDGFGFLPGLLGCCQFAFGFSRFFLCLLELLLTGR
jgi:hypothetical protein